ncbi:MAG: ABC transporter permease [Candidatus Delongbacteria bacterium]|jgi:ABC-2 type transport system permease protein|nr:ABC transporter permease [Candidatus Delongbacteria bacterium]
MRTVLFLLEKEFRQIFRNKFMLPMIFILPLAQTIIMVHAASFDLKEIRLLIVDEDASTESRNLEQKFIASPYYVTDVSMGNQQALNQLISGKKHAVLTIPSGFEADRKAGEQVTLQLLIDAVNQQNAGLINAYTRSILMDYSKDLMVEQGLIDSNENLQPVRIHKKFWYNPGLNYKHYMLPGILVILVTIIGGFLTALNIVREREMGTMEQINVTPIRKWQFMMGKLIPFTIIALFDLGVGLFIGWLLYGVPVFGSIVTLFVFSLVYLFTAVAMGLLISNEARTQQQVMFTVFFFFVLFILMSGIFTPVESMPAWAQIFNHINPLYYFMKAIRMILLKGSALADVTEELISLLVLGAVMFGVAILRYRKTS